jgi:hypothetical protein
MDRIRIPDISPTELVLKVKERVSATYVSPDFLKDGVLRDLRGQEFEVMIWEPHRFVCPVRDASPYFQKRGFVGVPEALIAWALQETPMGTFVTVPERWMGLERGSGLFHVPFYFRKRNEAGFDHLLGETGLKWRRHNKYVAFREIKS